MCALAISSYVCISFSIIAWQEKSNSIPDDIAKDLSGVQSQLRKHKALEHELSGNEQQVSDSLLCMSGEHTWLSYQPWPIYTQLCLLSYA